jgi:hypothetical protein
MDMLLFDRWILRAEAHAALPIEIRLVDSGAALV